MVAPALCQPESPLCDIKHTGPDAVGPRSTCQTCRARKTWRDRLRRDQIRQGLRPRRRPEALSQPADKCPEHPRPRTDCHPCRAYIRYQRARLRQMHKEGRTSPKVPLPVVQQHLEQLLDKQTGGWTIVRISKKTGVALAVLHKIRGGGGAKVYGVTAGAILALEPLGQPTVFHSNTEPVLETQRIVQGLMAQGWTTRHMANMLGLRYRTCHVSVSKFAYGRCGPSVNIDTRDKFRALRGRLGHYDITVMATPLPGMSALTARKARAAGWKPMSWWNGRDITDPNVTTAPPSPVEDVEIVQETPAPPAPRYSFVDRVLRERATAAIQTVTLNIADDTGRSADIWIEPLAGLTRFTLHLVWWMAETSGLNDTQIGALLGYDTATTLGCDAGQRQANRIRERVLAARAWIDSDPYGKTPDWLTRQFSSRPDFTGPLTALMAVHEPTFGAGWSVAELAGRCQVSDDDMHTYLAFAARLGDQPWTRPAPRRHRTTPATVRHPEMSEQAA